MDILTSGIFWGAILILIGISIILKITFGINIPIIRILFALLLIWWGIKLITGISFQKKNNNTVLFGKSHTDFTNEYKELNVVFGKATADLSAIGSDYAKREINIVFGSADIYIDENIPLKINSSAAFGAINFPDETIISFGERKYRSPGYRENEPFVPVELNVVFGNANIRKK